MYTDARKKPTGVSSVILSKKRLTILVNGGKGMLNKTQNVVDLSLKCTYLFVTTREDE